MKTALHSRLSRCPRCSGNLGLEYDPPGSWDVVCLQCGFRRVMQTKQRAVDLSIMLEPETAQETKAA
jgi:DNA-directed RNA polymerase subunit RPC12/RpoP